jgi:aryl-alcohol dehydrogenase-like predicted oxidoreductase
LQYRKLGHSGLEVSAYGLGVMTFGGQTGEDDAFRQMDMAFEAGVTLFDTAENYPTPIGPETQGRSEALLGKWIAARKIRDKVVIATKVAGPGNVAGDLTHVRGSERCLNAANISAAVDASLIRLGTDYIDLYQVHWPERAISTHGRQRFSALTDREGQVSIEETLAALAQQVNAGKLRAVGVCNETPWGTMRYLFMADLMTVPRLASIQNGYSLLDRQFEIALAEVATREGIGLIGYSPLAAGTLTGKYGTGKNGEAPVPISGSRSEGSDSFVSRLLSPARQHAIAAYADIAAAQGLELAHMALAFAAQQPFMASVLMAASNAGQLASNLGAIDLELPKEVVQAINAIHDSHPNPR